MSKDKLTSTVKDKYGNEWSITAQEVYESIIQDAPLYSNFDSAKHYDALFNVAGQLQFLEFTELMIDSFEFEIEGEIELPDFAGGGNAQMHNQVEHSVYKQGVIAVASVAEALCFILILANKAELPKRVKFETLIEAAKEGGLIDDFDTELLHELRKLRNSLHLHGSTYDLATFTYDNYVTAKSCLYWLLLHLLKIDERVMSIHFPFLPKLDKEELYFEV
jgi:hypothetical protein